MGHVGGSNRVRDDLARALEVGRKVTAKVRWQSKGSTKSQARWIHCTPLLGVSDAVGVWMVILVDDEDEDEGRRVQEISPLNKSNGSTLGSGDTAEALPWDHERHSSGPGVLASNSISVDRTKNAVDETRRQIPRRPLYRQPTDTGESFQIVVRPGPKIAGKAYSFMSASDQAVGTIEDGSVVDEDGSRPPSSSSSAVKPIQSTMQPKLTFAGRPSLSRDAGSIWKPPFHMPYQRSEGSQHDLDGQLPVRKTYKSLSPYNGLFDD